MTKTKSFDPTVYAPLVTDLLAATLDIDRQTAPMQREAAWNKARDARDKVIAAEDDMKSKMNRLEAKLRKYDDRPAEERPAGYAQGNQNYIALLEAYEMLNAARRCVQLLGPWAEEGE